jgi:hypothetical protein
MRRGGKKLSNFFNRFYTFFSLFHTFFQIFRNFSHFLTVFKHEHARLVLPHLAHLVYLNKIEQPQIQSQTQVIALTFKSFLNRIFGIFCVFQYRELEIESSIGDTAERQVAYRQFLRRNASAPQAPIRARLLLFHR